jgi:hypothetical protein
VVEEIGGRSDAASPLKSTDAGADDVPDTGKAEDGGCGREEVERALASGARERRGCCDDGEDVDVEVEAEKLCDDADDKADEDSTLLSFSRV